MHKVNRASLEATGYYHLDRAIGLDDTTDIEVMIISTRESKNFAKALMASTSMM